MGDFCSSGKTNLFGRYLDPNPLAQLGKVATPVVVWSITSLAVGNEIFTPPDSVLPRVVCIKLEHDLAWRILGVEPDMGKQLFPITKADWFAAGVHNVLNKAIACLSPSDLARMHVVGDCLDFFEGKLVVIKNGQILWLAG